MVDRIAIPGRLPLAARFWPKVAIAEPAECWEWQAARLRNGYGAIGSGGHDGLRLLAHRVSYELAFGPIRGGLWVLHRCDNPPCVNPAHLFLGTHEANMRDMRMKGRSGQGIRNARARLTEGAVRAIRVEYAEGGVSMAALGQRYGVTAPHIHDIVRGKRWRWVA